MYLGVEITATPARSFQSSGDGSLGWAFSADAAGSSQRASKHSELTEHLLICVERWARSGANTVERRLKFALASKTKRADLVRRDDQDGSCRTHVAADEQLPEKRPNHGNRHMLLANPHRSAFPLFPNLMQQRAYDSIEKNRNAECDTRIGQSALQGLRFHVEHGLTASRKMFSNIP